MKIYIFIFLFASSIFSADSITTEVKIQGITINGNNVYLAIFNSVDAYKKQTPYKSIIKTATHSSLTLNTNLPQGEYVFSVFQDLNGNRKLDFNFLGMPKEPFGISNYTGKGIPGGFEKQKVKIDSSTKNIIVPLVKMF